MIARRDTIRIAIEAARAAEYPKGRVPGEKWVDLEEWRASQNRVVGTLEKLYRDAARQEQGAQS